MIVGPGGRRGCRDCQVKVRTARGNGEGYFQSNDGSGCIDRKRWQECVAVMTAVGSSQEAKRMATGEPRGEDAMQEASCSLDA